jgi:hypothetical protein
MSTQTYASDWTRTVDSEQRPEAPLVFYASSDKTFFIQNTRNNWIEVNESGLKRHLKQAGLAPTCFDGDLLSEVDAEINRIQVTNDVAYAAPLAGFNTGPREMCGHQILVTSSPKIIQAKEGDWPLLGKLIDNLLIEHDIDQRPYLYGWTKIGYEALLSGIHRPGQLLALAGPRASGKSLLQKVLTGVFGGRVAKPYRYMSNKSDFNLDLFGAEHLMIEDETAATDFRARRDFGSKIKDFTVNKVQSCHGKHLNALSLEPQWRVSLTLNDEIENLLILPPIDESLADKIILLRANKKPMPVKTDTANAWESFGTNLMAEIPAFLWYLQHWEIPPLLVCNRFGIKHFHHPEILRALDDQSPEMRLLALIDNYYGSTSTGPTETTAEQLHECLVSIQGSEARSLLSWPNATGTYLGRLAKKCPDRVKQSRSSGARKWIITFPKP